VHRTIKTFTTLSRPTRIEIFSSMCLFVKISTVFLCKQFGTLTVRKYGLDLSSRRCSVWHVPKHSVWHIPKIRECSWKETACCHGEPATLLSSQAGCSVEVGGQSSSRILCLRPTKTQTRRYTTSCRYTTLWNINVRNWRFLCTVAVQLKDELVTESWRTSENNWQFYIKPSY